MSFLTIYEKDEETWHEDRDGDGDGDGDGDRDRDRDRWDSILNVSLLKKKYLWHYQRSPSKQSNYHETSVALFYGFYCRVLNELILYKDLLFIPSNGYKT